MWLPPKDDVLAPGIFNEGTPGPRWFDFSTAPDVPGFESSTCPTDITWAGQRAFRMNQREIIERAKTQGAAFWFWVRVCVCAFDGNSVSNDDQTF